MIPQNDPSKLIELVIQLYKEIQNLKERMNYLEYDLHSKSRQLEDKLREQDSLLFWR